MVNRIQRRKSTFNYFKFNKKGVSLSLNTVVIAVLLLVVLAIILVIFGGGMSQFSSGIGCPEDKCVVDDDCSYLSGDYYSVPMKCENEFEQKGRYCCIKKG